jgi:hypothetical protein
MTLRHRPMLPTDVRECVRMLAAHPVLGPRYGRRIADLRVAWLRVLECQAKSAVVFEELNGSRARIWGFGISVFVRDDFVRELKTPPFFWIGPELAKRIARGNSPVLSYEEMRETNSHDGLNLLTWEGFVRLDDTKNPENFNKVMGSFVEEHRGFRWKEIISIQADSGERLQAMLKAGGMLWEPSSHLWTDSPRKPAKEIVRKPHVIGLSRVPAARQAGSWADSLFDYQPPRIGFTRGEQRLLLRASLGGTDTQLSNDLSVSLSTVKKTWRAIYNRAAAVLPELIQAHSQRDSSTQDRGREKKQRIIAYLREHPEELRPVSRKSLPKAAPPPADAQARNRAVSLTQSRT